MVDRTCKHCQKTFSARQADVNRGWALFCSKTCKSKSQNISKRRARKSLTSYQDDWDFSFDDSLDFNIEVECY